MLNAGGSSYHLVWASKYRGVRYYRTFCSLLIASCTFEVWWGYKRSAAEKISKITRSGNGHSHFIVFEILFEGGIVDISYILALKTIGVECPMDETSIVMVICDTVHLSIVESDGHLMKKWS